MRTIVRSRWLCMAVVAVYAALPALADWGQAESADFTLNTVPEPAVLLVLLAGAVLLRSRTRSAS